MNGDVLTLPMPTDAPHTLGRNLNHDPRNRDYTVVAPVALPTTSFRHRRYGACVDQDGIGECVIGATAHIFNCHPFRASFAARKMPCFTTAWLEPRYEEVTRADPYPGDYPAQDTGTDAGSSLKVAQQHGEIVGYEWAFGAQQGLATLPVAPLMQGTEWTDRMFHPDTDGRVHFQGEAAVGGHETVVVGYEVRSKLTRTTDRVWCLNDWGTIANPWGFTFGVDPVGDYFYLRFGEWADLIDYHNGDLARPQV